MSFTDPPLVDDLPHRPILASIAGIDRCARIGVNPSETRAVATRHEVHYRISGGRTLRRNVVTDKTGTVAECRSEIEKVLSEEHQVEPRQVQLLERPPEPPKPKQKASDIRKLSKSQCLDMIEKDPRLAGLSTDGTGKEIEDRIIAALGLSEA